MPVIKMTYSDALRYVVDNGLNVFDITFGVEDKDSDQYGCPELWYMDNGDVLEIESTEVSDAS